VRAGIASQSAKTDGRDEKDKEKWRQRVGPITHVDAAAERRPLTVT
jgi:hypothetical protein